MACNYGKFEAPGCLVSGVPASFLFITTTFA
jgi:hypothetical protein